MHVLVHSSCLENRNEKKIEGNDHRKKKFDEYKRKTPTSTLLLQYLEIETNAFNVIMHVGYKKNERTRMRKISKKKRRTKLPVAVTFIIIVLFLASKSHFFNITDRRSIKTTRKYIENR